MDGFLELLISVGVISLFFVVYTRSRSRKTSSPPSLPWLPFVGSLPFLSDIGTLHLCLMKKAQRYGNIYSLYAGKRYAVVLNGYDIIREALVKRSADFGGRENIFAEYTTWNPDFRGMSFRPYSEEFVQIRKITIAIFKKIGMGERSQMENRMHEEIEECLKFIHLKKGKAFNMEHILRVSTMNVVYMLMLGKRYELNNPVGEYLSEGVKYHLKTLHPMFDLFPLVRYLPMFKELLKNIVPRSLKWKEFIRQEIDESLSQPGEEEIFVKEFLKQAKDKFDKSELYYIVTEFLNGGTDTTSEQLLWALILLSNHPDVQKQIHKEIDSVVHRERLPSLSDKLPYLEAVILEVMRLKTIAPLSVPHKTTCDTEVGGFFIPNDAQVIVNLWSAHMDPNVWKEPEKFLPERFLNENGEVINRDRMISFSLGKRQCPGEQLARYELFLFLSALMQQFEVLPPEGQTSILDSGTVSLVYAPVPFDVRMVPRMI